MEYFTSVPISEHITRICDPAAVAMYLVTGERGAVLMDTGCGFGNLREYVSSLTDKPVTVLLTHGHLDHAAGASNFDRVYMNHRDREVYRIHCDIAYRRSFYRDIPVIGQIPESEYARPAEMPFEDLYDGQVFDLGGISVEAVAVPGHTPGMMMLLMPQERTILFGDACGVGVMLFEDWALSVGEYRKSLLALKESCEGRYDRILRNHGTFVSTKQVLDDCISCCDDILAGRDDHVPVKVFGQEGFYQAKRVDGHGCRLDGREGNILYRSDKAR